MKLKVLFPVIFLSLTALGFGDELVKNAQTELKDQGFYYGEVTGVNSPETVAAIKRYQIRNGLEVTGTLSNETVNALGLGSDAPAAASDKPAPTLKVPEKKAQPVEPRTPPAGQKSPPVNLRRNPTEQDTDREFLKKQSPTQPPPPDEDFGPGTPPAATGGSGYAQIFARTPYASAPLEVQQSTLRNAQKFLRGLGFYREAVTGQPGPATEEAVLGYQRFIRLPLTGRLDIETLAAMRLLPGRGGAPVRPSRGQPLRGVLVY